MVPAVNARLFLLPAPHPPPFEWHVTRPPPPLGAETSHPPPPPHLPQTVASGERPDLGVAPCALHSKVHGLHTRRVCPLTVAGPPEAEAARPSRVGPDVRQASWGPSPLTLRSDTGGRRNTRLNPVAPQFCGPWPRRAAQPPVGCLAPSCPRQESANDEGKASTSRTGTKTDGKK